MSVRDSSGMNTTMMMPTPNTTGTPTSPAARSTMRSRFSPESRASPSRLNVFSTTTTEPSTIRPIAITSPPSDIRFAEMPYWFITMKVNSGVSSSVATTIRLDRMSPRNTMRMTTTNTIASSSTLTIV